MFCSQECLGISQVTQPASTAHQSVLFIMQQEVLHELCSFGMTDKTTQKFAEEMLLYLLQCQLLIPAPRWQHLLEIIVALMPIIQVKVFGIECICN